MRTGHAAETESRQSKRQILEWTQKTTRLENEVHQALALTEKETGKLLNYKQIMKNPKYKQEWSYRLQMNLDDSKT